MCSQNFGGHCGGNSFFKNVFTVNHQFSLANWWFTLVNHSFTLVKVTLVVVD